MNQRVRSVILVFTAVTAACAHPEATRPPEIPGEPVPVVRLRAEPYSFAFNSGLDQPGRIVVRDQSSWQTLWAQIYSRHSPVPPVPAIDFSQEMLVVVALGSRSSGGYSILVDGANEARNDGLFVTVRSTSPGRSCGTTAALTQPVDIARVPRREGDVSFIERSEVHECE
jgi:hypothetical protein